MKIHHFLFFCAFCYQISAFSQPTKGQWQANVSFTGKLKLLNPNTGNELTNQGFFASPSIGMWLSSHTLMGVSFPLGVATQIYKYPENILFLASNRELRAGLAPFVRYHFFKTKLRPFTHLQVGYTFLNNRSEFTNGSTWSKTTTKFQVQLGGGLVYYFNERIGIEALATYSPYTISYYDRKTQLSVGVQVRFGKDKK